MRTLYWYLYFCISLLFKTPALLRVKRKKAAMDRLGYLAQVNREANEWAARQLRNSGADIHISGEERIPHGPVLFVANHQGNFDIAIFMGRIHKDKGYISKAEMERVPLLRSWMRELGCIFLDRQSPRDSMRAIGEGIALLKSGYSLVVFPEGTRSKGGPVGEFKAGTFRLALKAGVPVVPVTIDGSYKLMEQNGNRIRPARVEITVHPPMSTAGLTKEEQAELPEQVREIICEPLGQ